MKIQKDWYFYCADCKEFVDAWKYDRMEDTGHWEHKLREITPTEFIYVVNECERSGCLDEEFADVETLSNRESLRFIKKVISLASS